MPSYPFVTVDVFTSVRFGGNPLAVVTDARGLTGEQMQQIAAEFNYSESTFVLPPDHPENAAQVRMFTPTTEIPFAGHPNVGMGYVLGRAGYVLGTPIGSILRFEEKAGLVEIRLTGFGDQITAARISAPAPLTLREGPDPQMVAACGSLSLDDILTTNHPPVMASVGLEFAIAELADLDALARAKPNQAAFEAANDAIPSSGIALSLFLYVLVSTDPLVVRARMFAPLDNVPEDPATGSASGALAGLLASLNPTAELTQHVTVQQGVEMGRPSTIELDVTKREGNVAKVVIGGECMPVMRGTIEV